MDDAIRTFVFVAVILGAIVYAIVESRQKAALRAQMLEKHPEWSEEVLSMIKNSKVATGMTPDMIKASWGKPKIVDQKEITKTGIKKSRWIYGQKGKNATYIYFRNGKVDKIQQ